VNAAKHGEFGNAQFRDAAQRIKSAANEHAAPTHALRRVHVLRPDAAGVDGEVVVKRRPIVVAMKWTQIGQIRSAAGQRIQATAGGGIAGYAEDDRNRSDG
jgi:hypothetical protein